MINVKSIDLIKPSDWRWPHFLPKELVCHGDGSLVFNESTLDRLEALRVAFGRPLSVSSGYRSPAYNSSVSSTGDSGPHTTGQAVDLLVRGSDAYHLLALALSKGFTGIGVSQKGNERFLHLDDLDDSAVSPRPTIWSY